MIRSKYSVKEYDCESHGEKKKFGNIILGGGFYRFVWSDDPNICDVVKKTRVPLGVSN